MKFTIPKIEFELMSLEEVAGILEWAIIMNNGILPVSNYVFKLYPELDKDKNWKELTIEKRTDVIRKVIRKRFINDTNQFKIILHEYEHIWDKYNNDFMKKLSLVLNLTTKLEKIIVKIGNIPVYPREVDKYCFYIGKMSEEDFIETVMHECCHFIYFEKWKELFTDWSKEEFNSPHIIWYLSEMVVDPILNNLEIQKVYKHDFKAYKNFYDININGKNLMRTIQSIYKENTIENAIIKSYEFVNKNQKYIIK